MNKHNGGTLLSRFFDRFSLFGKQRLQFLLVGGANTVFATLVFALLIHLWGEHTPAVISLCVASAISLITGFLAHRWIVFQVEGRFWLDFMRYASVNYATLMINIVGIYLLVDLLDMRPILTQIGIIIFTTVFNYLAHKFFSFRRE